VRSHYADVVDQFAAFAGDGGYSLENKTLLDVGCGDGLIDYGLLGLPLKHVTGLDVVDASVKALSGLPERIRNAGLTPPSDLSRFDHVSYDGTHMPFDGGSFDIVFSWSAFEHVTEVEKVLAEIKRVMSDDGFAFIQVFPWFASRHGSHLTDHISSPFFHLLESHAEIRAQLEAAAEEKPDSKDFMLGHLWTEFTHLNGISADDFYECAKRVGLTVRRVRLISMDEDISAAPASYSLSQLTVAGTLMLLVKN
jgi:ubiquinone/menaquinone biosynthesis C-methylase UbiE